MLFKGMKKLRARELRVRGKKEVQQALWRVEIRNRGR